jgi:cell division protease FtsH
MRWLRSNAQRPRFSDVGGTEEAKEQIRQLVQSRLQPGKYRKYGVVRNGILLHGPRGSGKTFLAEATAGEFGLNYHYVSSPGLREQWFGSTGENLRSEFSQAMSQRPVLFFIDELDSLGAGRQVATGRGDPGGAGRESNSVVIQLMQSIDQYRAVSGFVLMAATNLLDGLDSALIREGRFDLNVRVDLPTKLPVSRSSSPNWRGSPGAGSSCRSLRVRPQERAQRRSEP